MWLDGSGFTRGPFTRVKSDPLDECFNPVCPPGDGDDIPAGLETLR